MKIPVMRAGLVALVLVLVGCSGGADERAERHPGGASGQRGIDRPEGAAESEDARFARARRPFFGDLDEIRQRRMLRVLVSYSKTSFFHDGPEARGFEVDMLRKYEGFLNQDVEGPYARVRVLFVPTPFDGRLRLRSRRRRRGRVSGGHTAEDLQRQDNGESAGIAASSSPRAVRNLGQVH